MKSEMKLKMHLAEQHHRRQLMVIIKTTRSLFIFNKSFSGKVVHVLKGDQLNMYEVQYASYQKRTLPLKKCS